MTNQTPATYTGNRRLEHHTITKTGGGFAEADASWGWVCPVELTVGHEYGVESVGTTVVGVQDAAGRWLYRHSDQDLADQKKRRRERVAAEHQERYDQHHDEWAAREQALPLPLRLRLANFRNHGGHAFDLGGWGYELCVCELAVLYQASGGEDTAMIRAYAREEGTSGNQHDYARALAKVLDTEPGRAGHTVAALTPITGDPYYDNEGNP